MKPQVHTFSNGGYVVHKITGDFKGRCSAWFTEEGNLHDVEQLIGERSRRVKYDGPIWQRCQEVGRALNPNRKAT